MRILSRISDQLFARWKWVWSFRSRKWELEDYPIRVHRQKPDPHSPYENNPRFRFDRYRARIINWNVDGGGDSKQAAIAELRKRFVGRKATIDQEGKPLPRPGSRVPIEFASQERVNTHRELADDFIQRVLGLEWAFLTDQSSLWDFHANRTNYALLQKIKDVYGVNVDDIESVKICEILDRIAQDRQSQ